MKPLEIINASETIEEYRKHGFSIIKNCISEEERSVMSEFLTQKWQIYFDKEGKEKPHTKLEIHGDNLLLSPVFRKLATNNHLLGLATLLQGSDIQINYFGAQINPKQKPEKKGMAIHRDSGELYEKLGYPYPDLGVKFAVWLTDGMELDRGNFIVVPGSQYHESVNSDIPQKSLRVQAGDIIMFDPRMLHGRDPNHSNIIRQVIFIEYGPRWLEQKWNNTQLQEIRNSLKPLELQLYSLFDDPWRSFAPRWTEKTLYRHMNKV